MTISRIIVVTIIAALAGCASQVQIWANSDSNDLKEYAQTNPHYVHVGETIRFRVTMAAPGMASYLVVEFDGEVDLVDESAVGEYAFSETFGDEFRGRTVPLKVRAYQQVGKRDYLKRASKVLYTPVAHDGVDKMVGSAVLRIHCYQSKIAMNLKLGAEPDWEKGTLSIFGPAGKTAQVKLGKMGRHGFAVVGVAAFGGGYVLFYEPRHDEVQRAGITRAVFTLAGPNGKVGRWETSFNTR